MSRLQEERSAETRRRLLDATLATLVERGFANTTTTEIAERAGVSRGAQLHHFPTKQDLVLSAIDHLFEVRAEEFRHALEQLPQYDDRRIEEVIDLLWQAFRGSTFYAWLELVVAARTEARLQEAVWSITERFGDQVKATFTAVFGAGRKREDWCDVLLEFLFHNLEGLAIKRIIFDETTYAREYERALRTIKRFGRLLIEEAQA